MREREPGEKEPQKGSAPPDYLLDMLLSMARVARASGEPFLAYLIEMAALEAARLKDLGAPPQIDKDERH